MTYEEFSFEEKNPVSITFTLIRDTILLFKSHPKLALFLLIPFGAPAVAFFALLLVQTLVPETLTELQQVFVGFFAAFTFGATAVFSANIMLISATEQAVRSGGFSLLASVRTLLLRFPHVTLHATVTGLIGAFLATAERNSSGVLKASTVVLGTSYEVISFFALPAAVVDNEDPVSMFSRSAEVVFERFDRTNFISFALFLVIWAITKWMFSILLVLIWLPMIVFLLTDSLIMASIFGFLVNDPRGLSLLMFLVYILLSFFTVSISVLSVTKTLVYLDTVDSVRPGTVDDELYAAFDYMNSEVYSS